MQKVKTGIQDTKHIEIIHGLSEKQEIISGPYVAVSKELNDGDKLKRLKELED